MSRQIRSAHLALSMGATGLVVGMIYGTQIGTCPYPQLALGAHVQFMIAGMMGLLAGLVINSQSLCQLDDAPIILFAVDLAHYLLLVPCTAEGFYAFKGLGMPLLAERYNIVWEHSDSVFQALHYGPGVVLLLGWMGILYGLLRTRGQLSKVMGKTM